jgi:hypothetical protein
MYTLIVNPITVIVDPDTVTVNKDSVTVIIDTGLSEKPFIKNRLTRKDLVKRNPCAASSD